MTNEKIIKKVKFLAEFESAKEFDKWLKDQEKHLDMSLDNAFNKNVRAYQAKMKAVYKALEEAGDNPSESMMASMHKTIKEMVPLSKQLSTQFSKLKLGKELTEELEKANQEYVSLQNKIKATERLQKRMQNTKTTDGAKLNKEELTSIYNNVIAKSDKGLKIGKKTYGAGGLGVEQFIEDFKKDSEAFYKAKGEFEAVAQQLQTEVNAKIQSKLEAYIQRLKEQTDKLVAAKKALDDAQKRAGDAGRGKQAEAAVAGNTAALNLGAAVADTEKSSGTLKQSTTTTTETLKDFNKENKKTPGIIKKAATQVLTYGTIISLFKRGLSEAKRTIVELDKALTDMAIVTNLSREQAWKMVGSLQAIAKETGTTTTEVAGTVTKFLQQGKSMTQATQMAEAALMAASIAGIDSARSVDLLTNAMNGFQLSASQALEVSDKFAALAAASATDYEELAVALSKVAAQANLAGMSMDFTLGMLAKGIEVTREAPETIGTALKTVISRMRELNDYGETLEEGMDVNRVETALKNVGVQLRDTNGQFRNLEDVLSELGGKWNTLNVNQQANVAVALAGTRQQSRLIAMMQDFDRTLELVDISTNSYGATMAQQAEYMGSLEASMNQLTTAYEGLITNLTNSETIITLVNMLASVVELIGEALDKTYIMVPLVTLLALSGANILAQKIAENRYAKAKAKLDRAELINTNKKRLAEIQIRKEQLKTYINSLKERDVKEDTLENVLRQAKAQAEANGDTALAAKYAAEIAELNADDNQEKISLIDAQKEYNKLTAEEGALHAQNLSLQGQQHGLLGNLTSGFASLAVNISYGVIQMAQMLASQWAMIKAKKAEAKARKQNIAAIGAETAANTANAGASMAGSAGKIPYVGWIIGAIILTAVLGLAIAGIAGYMSSASKKEDDNVKSIEGNVKALQKMQAEMYNLGQQRKLVGGLAEEFDSLASKINQSADDLSRLEEIIQEFNDSVGFEMIAQGTDSTTALTIMRGYESLLESRMDVLLQEMNATLAKAVTSSETLKEYMKGEGASVVRQLVAQNYEAFAGASATTQQIIMDLLSEGKFFNANGGGIDYNAISNAFSAQDIEILDEALKSNSLLEYKNALTKVSESAAAFVKEVPGVFYTVSEIEEEILQKVDALQLSADQLERFGPILANIIKATGSTDLSELYANRMEGFKYKNQEAINQAIAYAESMKNVVASDPGIQKLLVLAEEDPNALDEDQKDTLKQYSVKMGEYNNIIAEATKAQEFLNMGATEFFNVVGNTKSLTDLQSEITKTTSHLDRLGKLMRGELHGAELDELLVDYPFLVKYLADDGTLDAAEYIEASTEMRAELTRALQTNVDKTLGTLKSELETDGINLTNEELASMTFNELQEKIGNLSSSRQEIITSAWYQYAANKMKLESDILGDDAWERIGKSTGSTLAQAQIEQYKEELSRYSKDEAGYQAAFDNYINSLDVGLRIAKADKDKVEKEIKDTLGKFKDQYEIINGEIFGKENGVLKALSEIDNVELRNALGTLDKALIEAYSNADETIIANAESRAEAYVDIQKEQWEKEVEIIEKKKEAYEEYFEEIDALEEEQERRQSKEDIIKQLSALSTGVDGTTKSKIKDLQGQLNDLIDEEQKAAREAARNELLEDLDNQTEELNNSMSELDDSIGILTRAFIGATGADIEGFKYDRTSELSYARQFENFLKENHLLGYSTGGLVNYTGLAMVHGSQTKPEAFLSADDTDLISNLVEVLHLVFDDVDKDSSVNNTSNNNNSITIENININTEHLNNTQDCKTAGSTLAQEFAAIIRERGLNVNVRK